MKKVFFILLLFCSTFLVAQNVTVTGIVKDKISREPLPMAAVLVKGTLKAVSTDIDGYFSIETSIGAELVFSYLFYNSQVEKVASSEPMIVLLQPQDIGLDEVVIVGAAIRKKDLTGSVTSITAKDMEKIPATSINQAIQGKMAGVRITIGDPRPGGSTSIKIRGNNSLTYGTNPIYVVDGMIMDGGFDLINPNDIASIDVMKDAAATAIYGSRGANGVVIVTTKKGWGSKRRIAYDGWYGVQSISRKIKTLDTKGLYELREKAIVNYLMDQPSNAGKTPEQLLTEQVHIAGNPYFGTYEDEAYKNNMTSDWIGAITQTGIQQNHNLSFSGTRDNGSYLVSLNYVDQKGLIKESGYKRYSGRVNLEEYVESWLKIGTSTSFVRSEETLVDNAVFTVAQNANPMIPLDVDWKVLRWRNVDDLNAPNPINSLTVDWDKTTNRTLSSNFIQIEPNKKINFRSTFSIDIMNVKDAYFRPNTTYQGTKENQDGEANQTRSEYLNWQWDNTVSYNNTFAQKHNVVVIAGQSASRNIYEYSGSRGYGLLLDDFSYNNLGVVTGGADGKDKFLSSDLHISSLVSFFTRVNYSYDSKYVASASIRRDGSSKFANNNHWGTFYAGSLAWLASEEQFIKELNIFDNLKLRAGYGTTGNQAVPNNKYMNLYNVSGATGKLEIGLNSNDKGNPLIKWETQKQINLGFNASVLVQRLSLSFDYFNIQNENLLVNTAMAASSGFKNVLRNVGKLENKGIEIAIHGVIIDTKDFRWNLSVTFSKDKNIVKKLYDGTQGIYYIPDTNTGIRGRTGHYIVGESVNSIYAFEYDKICQESDMSRVNGITFNKSVVKPGDILPKDKDDNDKIDWKDQYIVGKLDPDFYGGFATDITFKGFSLNATFNYSIGAKRISSMYENMMNGTGLSVAHDDVLNHWTSTNTNTDVPRPYFQSGARYTYSDVDKGIQNASFLKLSALTLAYNLPQSITNKLYANSVRLYITGANLFTITPYKGYDPEWGDTYPASRMTVFGINLSF